jgi:hypothetical protein
MVERGDEYLTRVEPIATRVAVIDPTTVEVVDELTPPDGSTRLHGWSITSDREWTYLYANCYRQFGYDLYVFTYAFDRSCSARITVARVPRGKLFDQPTYWDGRVWQSDPRKAVSVVGTAGRRINANQIEWNGSSFLSVNKEGDWWGDTVYFARSDLATGPFDVFDEVMIAPKCAGCNTFFATWVPRSAADRPLGALVYAIAHNRFDGVITSLYRPTFHEISAPPYLRAGDVIEIDLTEQPGIEPGITAAAINITTISPTDPGFITAYPCNQPRPTTSNVNYFPNQIVANLVIAQPDPNGHICIYTHATTDLAIDLAGTFTTTNPPGYQPTPTPTRILDTRDGTGLDTQY